MKMPHLTSPAALLLLFALLLLGGAFAERRRNIICEDERDRSFRGVNTGIIRDTNIKEDRDCKMKLQTYRTALVEIIVHSLYFSSGDCDEEYFRIKTKDEDTFPNATLCNGIRRGTTLRYNFTLRDDTRPELIFKLKMEEDSDKPSFMQSYIDLSFTISDGLARRTTTTSRTPLTETTTVSSTSAVDIPTGDKITLTEAIIVTATATSTDSKKSSTHTSQPFPNSTTVTISSDLATSETIHVVKTTITNATTKQSATTTTPTYSKLNGDDYSLENEDDDDIDDSDGKSKSSMSIDSDVVALSLGLVVAAMTILIVIIILCVYRRKKVRSHSSVIRSKSSDGVPHHPPLGNCLSNNYIGPHSGNRLNGSLSSKAKVIHPPLSKAETLYYSQYYSQIDEDKILGRRPMADNNKGKLFGKLLVTDGHGQDNYHRLESLSETSSTISGHRQSTKGGRPIEAEADRGVENHYVDREILRAKDSDAGQSPRLPHRTLSEGTEAIEDSSNLDQFGYIIVLPTIANEESMQTLPLRGPVRDDPTNYYEFVAPAPQV